MTTLRTCQSTADVRTQISAKRWWYAASLTIYGSLIAVLPCVSETFYVGQPPACSENNSGLDEQHPFCTVQKGIDAAYDTQELDDQVWVMPGTYSSNMEIDFRGTRVTVESQAGATVTTLVISGSSNRRTVVFDSGEDRHTKLIGFTITTDQGGGGIRCQFLPGEPAQPSSPTIQDCIIKGNTKVAGGGIEIYTSSPLLERNLICSNRATGVLDGGGGIWVHGALLDVLGEDPHLTIRDCVIEGNVAELGYGGGIFVDNTVSGEIVISRCTIFGNNAEVQSGGGIAMADVPNLASDPGSACDNPNCESSELIATVSDSLIFDNKTGNHGGGIFLGYCTKTTLINCTIADNEASDDGDGLKAIAACLEFIANSVFWWNGCEGRPEIELDASSECMDIRYSDIQGGEGGVAVLGNSTVEWGAGNIEDDPLFCQRDFNNYHVQKDSPVVDAGNNQDAEPSEVDLDGETRRVDVPTTPDTGNGTSPIVDMGAYENQDTGCSSNGVLEECSIPCPAGTLTAVDPPNGVVDARQPHAVGSTTPPQGIDTLIVTAPEGATRDCFSLCETAVLGDPNGIETVTADETRYTIELLRPITPGAVTTLAYRGAAPSNYLKYISHPANVNGDTESMPTDILRIIDCLNDVNPETNCPWGIYSNDVDRSGALNPADILRVIDLLYGADTFAVWNEADLPVIPPDSCPFYGGGTGGGTPGTPIVRWVGPSRDPSVLLGDYTFDSANPPNVVLKTTAVYEGKWKSVSEWRIGCTLDGDPADIGSITTQWGTPLGYNVTVKVGTAETPVRNVGTIDIAAQDTSHYTNLVLDVQGAVTTLAKCYASGNNGGRISGTVGGPMGEIAAKAIGVGAGGTGSLDAESVLDKLTNVAIPAGSTLSASMVLDELDVSGDLNGNVSFGEIWYASGTGSPKGRLHVQGTNVSSGNITIGDLEPAEGLEGGKIDIDGSYGGNMSIHKMDIDTMDTPNTEPAIEIGGLLVSGGVIDIDEDLVGTLDILGTGTSAGDITIVGDLVGDLTITGSMSGDIIITGSLAGTLTIGGTFTGNVCASNIVPGDPFPNGLDIATWGTGATICGAKYCTSSTGCAYTDDLEWCTVDTCLNNACIAVCQDRRYGDVNVSGGAVTLDDILATQAAFNNIFTGCGGGTRAGCDVWICSPQDGSITLDDILQVIAAFGGTYNCSWCDCGGDSMMMGGADSAADGPVDAVSQIIDYLATASGSDELDESGLWTLGDALAIYCQTSLDGDQLAEVVAILEGVVNSTDSVMNTEILTNLLEALQ